MFRDFCRLLRRVACQKLAVSFVIFKAIVVIRHNFSRTSGGLKCHTRILSLKKKVDVYLFVEINHKSRDFSLAKHPIKNATRYAIGRQDALSADRFDWVEPESKFPKLLFSSTKSALGRYWHLGQSVSMPWPLSPFESPERSRQ